MCGHDGHMAIVCSIADIIKEISERGDIYLLFQPAEEIGAGAQTLMENQDFLNLKPDYIFGLHNLPEYPAEQFVIRNNCFACCSVGLKIKIKGHSSHSAHPEQASDPLALFYKLQPNLKSFINTNQDNYFLLTLTHLKLGEESFGITPGDLEIFMTLRSDRDGILKKNKEEIKALINQFYSDPYEVNIEELDYFPTTNNSSKAFHLVKEVLESNAFNIYESPEPLKWSEDFGYYTQKFTGCYFRLGTGIDVPLHHPDYDFNDNVIFEAQRFYEKLIEHINNQGN
jgi:amidohydrolase